MDLIGKVTLLTLFAFAHGFKGDGRIVGGFPITIERTPYQVSIQYRNYHICGGSIISAGFVLTAAHCTHRTPVSYLSVR